MTQNTRKTDWPYLGREVVLILLIGYLFLAGGTYTGLIAHSVRLASAVLAAAMFGGWLAWRLLRGEKLPAAGVEVAWLFWLGSIAIAVLLSEDPRRSQSAGIIWLSYALVFYLALDLLRRGWRAELLEKVLLLSGAMVLGFGLLQLFLLYTGWQEVAAGLDYAPSFHYRISSILGDPNLLAATLNLLIPLALARAISSKNRIAQVLLGIYVAVSLVLVYFADSRGGFLALATGLGIVLLGWGALLSVRAQRLAAKLWTAVLARRALLLGGLVVILLAVAAVAWRVLSFEGDTTHAPALTSRDIYWRAAAAAFRSDPISGVGPGLYPVYLMQSWSTPPARQYLHAHSTPFNIAAETGLLGLASLAVFVVAAGRRAWRGWEGLDPADRARWVGLAAALCGFGVHSLVDDFLPFSITGTVLMLLLAMWLAKRKGEVERNGFSPLWLLLPALLAALLSINPLRASGRAEAAARLGNTGDWAAAAREMEAAAALDPNFAFYWMQTGYAYGRLAEENPDHTETAIAAYERAVALEPVYGLNYANLAALQWQAELSADALANLERAIENAPKSWRFWLNQGLFQENLGEQSNAESSYQQALELAREQRLDSSAAAFWASNEFRQQIAGQSSSAAADAETGRQEARELVTEARADIRNGNLEQAAESLAAAWRLYDQDPLLYLVFGELGLAQGELDEAGQYLQAGLNIQSTSNQDKSEMHLLLAEINDRRGDTDETVMQYEAAMAAILNLSSYGWGARGWTPYSYFVFQRQGFAEDTLPQLVRADIPVGIAGRLLRLAALYEDMGAVEKAEGVRAALQPYLPSISRH